MKSSRSVVTRVVMLGAVVLAASVPVLLRTESPVAATAYGVTYYISPPLVQNSYVTTGAVLESFDSGTNGSSCTGTVPIGVITGTCLFSNAFAYGGATTRSSSPVAGGTSTNYATGGGGSPTMTFTFNGARRYLGFWWSAGSPTNTVKFFNGADEVLSLTTADLITLLGSSAGTFGTTGSVTAVNGSTYLKHQYFGHPRGHTQASPVARSSVTSNEPFTYLHVFTSGGLTFDRVTFSGAGFEFDNLVVSDVAQTPATDLVNVGSITGTMPASAKTVTFDPGDGTGAMTNQVASAPEALSANSFTRVGYTFLGWSTAPNGQGTLYSDLATYAFSADVTLYARWSAVSYTVTYDTQGGSTVTSSSYSIGSAVTLPAAPTRTGFSFSGWFVASTGGTALGTTYSPPGTGNITLYAQWTAASTTTVPAAAPASNTTTTTVSAVAAAPTNTQSSVPLAPAPKANSAESAELPTAGSTSSTVALTGAMMVLLGFLRLRPRRRSHA